MRIFSLVLSLFCLAPVFAQTESEVIDNFRKDITFLSSDILEGRLTASSGELRSSLYIADGFKSNKLIPYGDSGTFFQKFRIVKLRLSQCTKPLLWVEENKKLGLLDPVSAGYYPLSYSCNKDSLSAFVFQAGYGIQAPELNYNDYKDTAGIRGKVFVIRIGSPESGNPHSKFESYEELSYKVNQAVNMGARGIVFVNADTVNSAPGGHLDRTVKPSRIPVIFAKNAQSLLNAAEISMEIKIAQIEGDAHNVIGFIDNKKKKTIVIGAHQDHLGYNEYGGSRTKEEGKIHNGADDNASGVAMIQQLVRKIKKSRKLRKSNYLFIAFSGEEQGLLGSNYFVNHPTIELASVKYMLNFDMVGRLDSNKKVLMIYGVGTSPEWKKGLAKIKVDSGKVKVRTTESGTGSSDHTSFYFKNVPVLHFFTGQHKDYHMPSDDENLINYQGMYDCYDVVLKMITAVNKTKQFAFTPTKQEEAAKMNFKVTLGIMPDYIYEGNGLRVDGVNIGKPGEKAGLMQGDIIIKMGDYTINSIQDYMKALSAFKKNDNVKIVVKRGNEEKTLDVVF